jgi:hypothetical protein
MAVTIAAGNSLADAGATFLPTTPGAKSVTLAMQTTDVLCASATGIAMSGTGTPAQVAVGPNPLQFGAVPCGTAHGALPVTLTNTSAGSVAFTDVLGLGKGSPFTIDVTAGTVPGLETDGGAGTAVITVTPKAIPVPASLDAGAFNDTLVVTPTAPFVTPTTITLEESASGAVLAVVLTDSSSFGTISNQSVSLPFTVTNTGNVDAPLTVAMDGGFGAAITTEPPTATADGGVAAGNVSFTPLANVSYSGALSVTTTAPLCSVAPSPITITGTGAVPVASFPSTAIAIVATCAAATNTGLGSVTITNNGNSSLSISGAASKNGNFIVESGSPSTIAAHGTGTISIAASTVGQGSPSGTVLNDLLTFATNEPGSPARSVPVTVTLSGANLSYQGGSTITISTCGGASSTSYTVMNTGDVAANVNALSTSSYPTGGSVDDTVSVNTCAQTFAPCTLAAPAQAFTSLTVDVATGAPTSSGICIPLPPLNVTENIDITPGDTCQGQCCK